MCNIACSVHSLPRFPTPNIPKRAIRLRVGFGVIALSSDLNASTVLTVFIGISMFQGYAAVLLAIYRFAVSKLSKLTVFYGSLGLDRLRDRRSQLF